MRTTTLFLWGITAFLVIGLLWILFIRDGYQDYKSVDEVAKCGAKTSCSTCLDTAGCGWCPGVAKCVPAVNQYPVVPRAGQEDPKAPLGPPLFSCPAATFVFRKSDCADLQCAELKTCRDCAGAISCGWCSDGKVCLPKDLSGNPVVPSGTTCDKQSYIVNSGTCPVVPCEEITNCADCANSTNCGFCKTSNKCVTLDKYGKAPAESLCSQADVITGAYQCPGMTPSKTIPPTSEDSTGPGPTAAELHAAQDNSAGMPGAEVPGTGTTRPVSPATVYTVVTAPGVARPVGSTSERPTFPDASGLTGLEPGPFETYIKMLVRSELAAGGVVHNEPFVANEPTAIGNATGYMKERMTKLLDTKA
jgi:hypothetical protein